MKVFAISDLHLSSACDKPMDVFGKSWENYMETISDDWRKKVREEDVVLLSGDFSWAMRIAEVIPDLECVSRLSGQKVLLKGNHDYWWNTVSQVRSILPDNFYALQNDCLRFEDVLICGTRGWTCPDGVTSQSAEDEKMYKRETERLKLSLEKMSKERTENDVVIGIMHFPPFDAHYDESEFTKLFVKYGVNKVVYGHLHGKDCRAEQHLKKFGMEFFLTSCDIVGNKLVEIL